MPYKTFLFENIVKTKRHADAYITIKTIPPSDTLKDFTPSPP